MVLAVSYLWWLVVLALGYLDQSRAASIGLFWARSHICKLEAATVLYRRAGVRKEFIAGAQVALMPRLCLVCLFLLLAFTTKSWDPRGHVGTVVVLCERRR